MFIPLSVVLSFVLSFVLSSLILAEGHAPLNEVAKQIAGEVESLRARFATEYEEKLVPCSGL